MILDRTDYEQWLDPGLQDVTRLKPILRPYPPVEMTWYPVNLRVNNPKHDDRLCVTHIEGGATTGGTTVDLR